MKYLILNIIVILAVACSVQDSKNKIAEDNSAILLVSDSLEYSQAVFLTKDNNQNPIIVWASANSDSGNYTLNFREIDKQNVAFGDIVKVEETTGMQAHQESMAKIGVKQNGSIVAIYRRENPNSERRFAGDIFYAESDDAGFTWSKERKLVNDTSSASQSFYDIALLKNGELGVCWLDSRKLEKEEGSSIYFNQTSPKGGFIDEIGVLGSTCQCCRTEIQVNDEGKINLAFRDIINDSIRDMVYVFSNNNGITFSEGKRISKDNWKINGCPHTGPSIATNDNQRAIAWFTMGGGKGIYFTVGESSEEMSPPRKLISQNGTHPQMIWAKKYFYLAYELRKNISGKVYRQIVVTLIDRQGEVYKTIEISEEGIDSQMPVISQINNKIIIVWVDKSIKGQSLIKAKLIAL